MKMNRKTVFVFFLFFGGVHPAPAGTPHLNMEAGSSYLQTTDPRAEVEKVVMDGFVERQTGRGSDGLVSGRRVLVLDE